MKRFCIALSLLSLAAGLGCEPATETTDSTAGTTVPAADAHAGHDHGHGDVGPHGGHLLHLEPTGSHAEWTHDDDAKLITVYVDDFDAASISKLLFEVKIGDEVQEFPLTATDNGWTITSEELLTHINMGEAATVHLVLEDSAGRQAAKIEAHDHHHH